MCFPWLACLALGGGEDAPPDWRALDEALARRVPARNEDGRSFGVLVRAFFTNAPEEAGTAGRDLSGNVFEDVDAYVAAEQGPFELRLGADFDQGDARLEDAWVRAACCEWLGLRLGQFKPRVVRSGSIPDDGLLFRERSFLGAAFDLWDDGVELGGHYDQFDYWLALTDGSNGSDSDHFWSARGEWALYDSALEDREGARGAPNHLRVLLGAALFDDVVASTSDGGGYGADLALTFGPYAFHGEWASLEDSFVRTIDVFDGQLLTLGDGDPLSFTLARRMGERFEAAVRFQRADDADSTEAFTLGASYVPASAPVRFVADLALVEGDSQDFSIFSLGLQAGSSGLGRPFAR
jgi:hypothetical protein